MYCQSCGAENEDNAFACRKCGAQLQTQHRASGPGPMQYVPTYLAHSILLTILCCLPLGIVAIVYAAQVNSKLAVGDYAGAVLASDFARKWCWVAFIAGLISIVLPLCIYVFIGAGVVGAHGMR